MSNQPNTIFGIDLGTTYSCIAYVDEYSRPAVIPNAEGDLITPSVVQFNTNERIVGKEAKNSAALYPQSTIQMIKREMGKSGFAFTYEGVTYSPQEISSYILRKVVQDAEQFTGQSVKDVVITCPAYFGVAEREATAEAGKIAGLNVRSIINEPTAAAIAYGLHEAEDQVVLVYDLGGGTFDITMIEIKGGNITVVCTDGDHFLGGRNWDEIIVNYLAEEWQKEAGTTEDPLESLETLEDLFLKAQTAKHTLTQREKTDVRVVHNGQAVRVTLTREKFDELTEHLLARTIALTRQTLSVAASRGYTKFDQFLLVGGATRMPQVTERIRAELKADPQMFEPDLAVAKGAAIYGQKLALDQEIAIRIAEKMGVDEAAVKLEEVPAAVVAKAQEELARDTGLQIATVKSLTEKQIRNVASRSFGVIAWHPQQQKEVISNLIVRNNPVPAETTKRYGTKEGNQISVLIRIMENLAHEDLGDPDDSREIGQAELTLPPGLPASAPLSVTFELDEQGRLHIKAKEMSKGRDVEVTIQTEGGISQDELDEAVARSQAIVVT